MVLMQSGEKPLKWEAADFKLKGTDDKEYSLKDFEDKKGLLIVFICNHCPYAKAAWPLLKELDDKYGEDIAVAGINSNDEVSHPDDSFERMKEEVKEWGITFAYLRDESQSVAKEYEAKCTPDPYLFKKQKGKFLLYYRGRINDNWQNPDQVKEKNLEEAMETLVKDEPPPENQPASMGCSIKWKS